MKSPVCRCACIVRVSQGIKERRGQSCFLTSHSPVKPQRMLCAVSQHSPTTGVMIQESFTDIVHIMCTVYTLNDSIQCVCVYVFM